jgi:hypothetical protein
MGAARPAPIIVVTDLRVNFMGFLLSGLGFR